MFSKFATTTKKSQKNSNNMVSLTLQVDGPRAYNRESLYRGGGGGLVTGMFFMLTG